MHRMFSIVIPMYNAEKYIEEMIYSIIHQSYKDWELIIIDDGSTDNSGIICDGIKDSRISVYHTSNNGQMAARIDGILKATGDYTVVVDADDALEVDCLKTVNAVLDCYEYDMVAFPYYCCTEDLSKTSISSVPDYSGAVNVEDVLKWVITTYNHGLYNKVTKTELLKKGAMDATRKRLLVNGDYALVIPMLCYTERTFFIDTPLYRYRVYNSSISHSTKAQHLYDTCFVTRETVFFLNKAGKLNPKVERWVFSAFLHMIGWMSEALFVENRLTKGDIDLLHSDCIYKESERYEKKSEFSRKEYVELKALRKRNFFIIQMLRMAITAKRKIFG